MRGKGRLDADRGSNSAPSIKVAEPTPPEEFADRSQDRSGARGLDEMIEDMPGTRAAKDKERAFPRDTSAKVGHERKRRKLPDPGETRKPMAARQRDDRSQRKNRTQESMSKREFDAMSRLMSTEDGEGSWRSLNDRLSEVVGDRQLLEEKDQRTLGRLDRAIQRYEAGSDRGHVVYLNVQTPGYINRSNIEGYVGNQWSEGTVVEFDRYSGAAHNMHEIEPPPDQAQRTVVFEIQTRRGMYLGGSQRVDDTGHLLPRGMRMKVAGTHVATYERPDGSTGERVVVQLVDDLDPSLEKKESA